MRRFGIMAASGLVAMAALAGAPSPTSPYSPEASKARARRPTPEMASVTGTVKKYQKGKSIVIVGSDGRGRKLVLDGTTRIDGPVQRGQEVTAVWMTDEAGRPHVNSIFTTPRAGAEATAAADDSGGAAKPARSLEPTPQETAVAPTATPHGPAEDAVTPATRRTPVPGMP